MSDSKRFTELQDKNRTLEKIISQLELDLLASRIDRNNLNKEVEELKRQIRFKSKSIDILKQEKDRVNNELISKKYPITQMGINQATKEAIVC